MPRQQINTPATRIVTEAHETNDFKPGEYATHWAKDGDAISDAQHFEYTPVGFLGWNRSDVDSKESVQLSMVVSEDELLRIAKQIEHRRAINPVTRDGQMYTYEFATQELSRDNLQVLIRTARRARDTVFGSDE